MEGELGAAARIAIALIVIGVVISVIFVILGFTRTTTNQGITTVQNSMDSMQLQQFDDYDQQVISGTQVSSTLKLFEGRPIGIMVRTKAEMAANGSDSGYNYGARFAKSTDGTIEDKYFDVPAKNSNESWYEINLFSDSNGVMTYNMDYLNTKKSGTNEYIRPTAKFLAEIIKDQTGTIVGICFTQQ
ncbi:hypothetical protein [Vallitalea okinawensis]|uniref:hypothetical protein n=1 Tax=Vallitalea okinawensis TaxID=2078660 RepID=UPI000CFBB924|nr:hypothetical protein [Vallitalea okinawensis]